MAVTYSALVSQNGAMLTFWLKLCTKINTTLSCIFESVIESEQTSYTSSQSPKRLFRKIQIFEFAYSALPLFYFLFRFKNHLCIVLYIRKALKNRKRLVPYRHSLRSACFAKYRFLNLNILHFRCFIPCLGLKSSLHRVVYTKSVEESEEISCISLQSSKRSFRKICIFCTSAVLFLV